MENESVIDFISVENVGGITDPVRVNFGQRKSGEGRLIVLAGRNGVGKTSFLDGVRALFSGGHAPELIHQGADKAIIRMGTTDGAEYVRTITANEYYLNGIGSDGIKFYPPEAQMKRMASGFGFDPIAFDQAALSRDGKKKQLDFFLKVLPMKFTAGEIKSALGPAVNIIPPPTGDQDIAGIAKLLKELTGKRANISSARDEKANSVETFRKSLPAEDSGTTAKDWGAEVKRLTKERNDLEASETSDVEYNNRELKSVLGDQAGYIRELENKLSDEYQRLLAIARSGRSQNTITTGNIQEWFEALQDHYQQCKDAANEAQSAIDAIKAENAAIRERLASELATAQAANDGQQRTQGIRDSMATLQKEALALSDKWDTVATAVKAIEELKQSKLTDLPVKDVEVREDGLYLDGRQWSRANQARRWLKSIEIGCQADAELLLADEAEHLDKINWDEFEAAVVGSGRTVLAARVSTSAKLVTEPAEALVMV